MIIISRKEDRPKLTKALEEKNTIKLLIFGNGELQKSIAHDAEIRAKSQEIRQVIWVKEPVILTKEEHQRYQQGDPGIIICTLNLENQPVHFLSETDGVDLRKIERAFATAQKHSRE